MMKLLTTGNPKIAKGEKLGYLTSILHLAPARLSGYQVCPMATKGCAFACLNTAGRGGIFKKGETTNVIQKARIRKTQWFFEDRQAFMAQLYKEIENTIKLAEKHGLIPVFRLNGTSDIRWETVEVFVRNRAKDVEASLYPNIMAAFPDYQFYDYTAIPNRRNLPENYHITFSRKEDNDKVVSNLVANTMINVAVVFKSIPETYLGRPVVSGDETDLRFLDPKGVIVALKAKGDAKKDVSGFVV